jgi:hypothetical protein
MTLGAPAKLAIFCAGLALVGSAAALAGAANRGAGAPDSARADAMHMQSSEPGRTDGLASSVAGYTLVTDRTVLPLRRSVTLRLRILDASGGPETNFDLDGGVRLHLIVVRRDLTGYQHLHPRVRRDGSWSVPVTLTAPGAYRAYADFEVDGAKTVLGTDLFAAGTFIPSASAPPSLHARADGYDVALVHGALHAGEDSEFSFRVRRNGHPVTRFDEYVGRRGHLVALHEGDLAYTHVHPVPGAPAGEIRFDAELAAAGEYRLFLQFKTGGVVHTVPFSAQVTR